MLFLWPFLELCVQFHLASPTPSSGPGNALATIKAQELPSVTLQPVNQCDIATSPVNHETTTSATAGRPSNHGSCLCQL